MLNLLRPEVVDNDEEVPLLPLGAKEDFFNAERGGLGSGRVVVAAGEGKCWCVPVGGVSNSPKSVTGGSSPGCDAPADDEVG